MRVYTANWRFTLASLLDAAAGGYLLGALVLLIPAMREPAGGFKVMCWVLAGLLGIGAVFIVRCARDIRQ